MFTTPTTPISESERTRNVPTVVLEMDAADFGQLWTEHHRWADCRSDGDAGFEPVTPDDEISLGWAHAYWVGDEWTPVLMARCYLVSIGESCQVVVDLRAGTYSPYVILTDYEDPVLHNASLAPQPGQV